MANAKCFQSRKELMILGIFQESARTSEFSKRFLRIVMCAHSVGNYIIFFKIFIQRSSRKAFIRDTSISGFNSLWNIFCGFVWFTCGINICIFALI